LPGAAASGTVGSVSAVQTGVPARVPADPAESFSEAFVKHAASANSKWTDLKKRPKVIDPSQPSKPTQASGAKEDNNPMDVLNKLEKARKAKKLVGNAPD
jgi:ABC-type proline/glycine betaine transport system ATPase subunit